jgi:hypothetical protein
MINKDDFKALIITIILIAIGYASMYAFVYLGEYLNILVRLSMKKKTKRIVVGLLWLL